MADAPIARAADQLDRAAALLLASEPIKARLEAARTRLIDEPEEFNRLAAEMQPDWDELERLNREIAAAQASAGAALDQAEAAQRR